MAVLEGITVLDLSRLIAGPYATMVLADLGARVIKVESLTGEDGRHFGPPFYGDVSVTFMTCNRGKESISFDVRTPAGKEILARLLRRSQVVVHNGKEDFPIGERGREASHRSVFWQLRQFQLNCIKPRLQDFLIRKFMLPLQHSFAIRAAP